MYLNIKAINELFEISQIPNDILQTKAKIVKAWSKKYCINEKTLAVIWRRAELIAAKSKKCKCIPWGVVTDIFKMSVRKHFKLNKCNRKEIKPAIIKGKYVKTHKDVEPGGALVRHYLAEIRKLKDECPNFDKLPDCKKSLNENKNGLVSPGKAAFAAIGTAGGISGGVALVNKLFPSHENPVAKNTTEFFQNIVDSQ